MTFLELFLIALSLSLDAAVLAIGVGALRKARLGSAVLIALLFAVPHAFMPVLGYALGLGIREHLLAYGNVASFVLLFGVGVKMLFDSFKPDDGETSRNLLRMRALVLLSLVASIDAFVIGISFLFVPISLPLAASVIGGVTFIASLLGIYIGTKSRHLAGKRIEILGALILIALAFKILLF